MQPHQPNKNFLPGNLKTIKGADASIPHAGDNRIILCFCDLNGTLESDFAKTLVKRWAKVNSEYRGWYRSQNATFKMGKILPISVQTDTEVVCMLVINTGEFDYEAMKDAMISLGRYASTDKKNIHINKTEENWDKIEPMLDEHFIKSGVNVNVYVK